MSQLYSWAKETIGLDAAVRECAGMLGSPAYALLYRPDACVLGLLEQRNQAWNVIDSTGSTVHWHRVFEARLFGSDAELRWLQDGNSGTACLISEQPLFRDRAGWTSDTLLIVQMIKNEYLLWGSGVQAPRDPKPCAGWSRLAEARIGKLDVPIGYLTEGQRAVLQTVEYLAEVDGSGQCLRPTCHPEASGSGFEPMCHGNVVVIEERLVGLAVLGGDTNG